MSILQLLFQKPVTALDFFTDTDNVLLEDHTPTNVDYSGNGWAAPAPADGVVEIINNQAKHTSDFSSKVFPWDVMTPNVIVDCDIIPASKGRGGVSVRNAGTGALGWTFRWQLDDDQIQIVDSGVVRATAALVNTTGSQPYHIKVIARDSTFILIVTPQTDAETTVSFVSNVNQTETHVGISLSNGVFGTIWDNFKVRGA